MLEVAQSYLSRQRELAADAVELVLGIARRARTPEAWRDAVARIGPALLAIQVAAAAPADSYLDEALEAQGASPDADGVVFPEAWTDYTDGGGSWLANLVYAVNALPKAGVASDLLEQRVRDLAGSIALSGIQDTGRSSVQAAMLTRPAVKGYVRMLAPPSCARCAVLAGRRYRAMVAFRRHRRCDCRHIPTAENSGDWTTSPADYFRSLPTSEQERVFTKAGAQAIRDTGISETAINQIVNARAGITTVTAFGREIQVTTVGTTKRALFGGYEVLVDGTLRKRSDAELQKLLPGNRYRTATASRLLPDEIYRLAEEFGWDRAETLRQLRRFAYVL